MGVPFYFEPDLRSFYTGSFWQLLNPFALLTGLLGVCHAGNARCGLLEPTYPILLTGASALALFIVAGLWIAYGIDGYQVVSAINANDYIDPLHKVVEKSTGAWLHNYRQFHWMLLAPAAGIAGLLLTVYCRPASTRAAPSHSAHSASSASY